MIDSLARIMTTNTNEIRKHPLVFKHQSIFVLIKTQNLWS